MNPNLKSELDKLSATDFLEVLNYCLVRREQKIKEQPIRAWELNQNYILSSYPEVKHESN